jgi:hypothetical protein
MCEKDLCGSEGAESLNCAQRRRKAKRCRQYKMNVDIRAVLQKRPKLVCFMHVFGGEAGRINQDKFSRLALVKSIFECVPSSN